MRKMMKRHPEKIMISPPENEPRAFGKFKCVKLVGMSCGIPYSLYEILPNSLEL